MNFHLLHPMLGLLIIPVAVLGFLFWHKQSSYNPWEAVCDAHLLNAMLPKQTAKKSLKFASLWILFWLSILIAIMGPAIDFEEAKSFKSNRPIIILLDMSQPMFEGQRKALPIQQVKLALSAWLQDKRLGPWALILFTNEAYLATPLSDDGNTMIAVLPELTAEVMPTSGYNLEVALKEAQALLARSGFNSANILLINHTNLDDNLLKILEKNSKGFPNIGLVEFGNKTNKNFGKIAVFNNNELAMENIPNWLASKNTEMILHSELKTMVWHDIGRWFLIPAILCLLFAFRKGYLENVLA